MIWVWGYHRWPRTKRERRLDRARAQVRAMERRAQHERAEAKAAERRQASWDRMKADIARKHGVSA